MQHNTSLNTISSEATRDIILKGCNGFYEVLTKLQTNPDFFHYMYRANESTMRHFFMKGLIDKYCPDHFDMLTEISANKKSSYGRIDLILDNREHLFVFECKAYYSRETEPSSDYWKDGKTHEFYQDTLNQANDGKNNVIIGIAVYGKVGERISLTNLRQREESRK